MVRNCISQVFNNSTSSKQEVSFQKKKLSSKLGYQHANFKSPELKNTTHLDRVSDLGNSRQLYNTASVVSFYKS